MSTAEDELRIEIERLKRDHAQRIEILTPNLPSDLHRRAKLVWDAAWYAHENGQPGDPGPIALIAAALTDAEHKGAVDLVDSMRRTLGAKDKNGR